MAPLNRLFAPERVALVGATDRPGSIGRAVLENLLDGFEGEVVPVNPNRETVLGRPCVPDVAAAGDVDLAVVVVPAAVAVDVLEELGAAGVEHAVVITAGFAEVGGEGEARERRLVEAAERHGIALVGPNSFGVVGTAVGLDATFGPTTPLRGGLSFLSQSGAVVSSVLDWATDRGIGFDNVVSMGNKAVLDEVDFVEAWDEDPDTRVVAGYLESVTDGRAFLERVRAVASSTPVVLLKAGRTASGARAAASHTGAIAGSDRVVDAAFAQAGVLRATSLGDLFDASRALAGQPLPDGDGVAIVTNAGGLGVLATDAVGEAGLSLATLDDATVDALAERLPDEVTVANPLDIVGDADVARFADALDRVLADPGVGAVVVLSAPNAIFSYPALAGAVADRSDDGTPLVACFMGGSAVREAEAVLREAGVPNYEDPARAVRGLEALFAHREVRERPSPAPRRVDDDDRDRAAAVVERARERGRSVLGVESLDLLEAYGLPTADGEMVTDAEAAADAAERHGGPVVLKVVSPDLSHKTEVGGVEVGVAPADAAATFEALVERAAAADPDATVDGVLVQAQVDVDAGVEMLLGVTRDPAFGPVVAFGLGGIHVETFDDVALRVAPVDAREARGMTEELQSAPLLRGARGRPPADLDAVVEAIEAVSRLALDHPSLVELDVNPLVASADGVVAVDLRATLDPEGD